MTARITQKIQCNADTTIPPFEAADIDNSRLASDPSPTCAKKDEPPSNHVDNVGISTGCSSIDDGGPIKLHHTTPELLKSVINKLKKSALKEWAASCGTLYSNNQALNKKRLCELLDSCTTGNNAKTFPLLALLTSKLDDCSVKMELLANKQSISLTAASRKQDLINYYGTRCQGPSSIEFVIKLVNHVSEVKLPTVSEDGTSSQPHKGSTPHHTTPSKPLSKPATSQLSGDGKSGSKRNKKHRKKKRAAESTATSDQFSKNEDEACEPSNKQTNKSKGRSQKKSHLNSEDDNSIDTNRNDLCQKEKTLHEGREANDQTSFPTCQSGLARKGSVTSECNETKNSLSILQDSILELKEELLHQKATSDLILSSNTMSDNKLVSYIKNQLSPLESALAQLKNQFHVLKETQQEQNDVLARLVDKFDELPGNKLDRKCFDQNVSSLQDCFKSNRHRLETLEIGQGNLKLAIRELSKSVNDLSLKENAAHSHGQTESPSPSLETETSRADPRQLTYKAVRSLIGQPKNGLSACQQGSTSSIQASKASQPTNDVVGSVKVSETNTWADKAKNVQVPEDEKFTLVTKGNARNHKELPLGEYDEGKHVKMNSRQGQRRNDVETNTGSSANDRYTSANHQLSTFNQYRQYNVLLIHDENFKNFNQLNFSNQFNVHQFNVTSYDDLKKKRKQLNSVAQQLKPDCIYIHVGMNDLIKKRSTASGAVHDLAEHLLKITKAQICFSLLIPSSNDTELNDRIQLVNKELRSNISWFRKSDENSRSRIFTFPNYQIRHQNIYSSNTGFNLTEKGEKMLYIRLREGLKKTLRIKRLSYHNNSPRLKHSTNRFSDD